MAFIPKTAAPLRAEFRIINRAGGANPFRFIDAQTLQIQGFSVFLFREKVHGGIFARRKRAIQ